ncbi:hypothetical protein ACFFLM_16585 [Deinococcus oregonensis]|uniref:Uncharacterized protein n=1 Tax=Deinococcus oregonensis TaxID=1805970 RepID=A0ABV6B1K6_9DEIO
MSAITSRPGTYSSEESAGRAAAGAATGAHPSWQYQDRFELWVDWMQRGSGGHWQPHEPVLQRAFRTREETLLQAERFIQRGDFPMGERSTRGTTAPVTLMKNRRTALLQAFREAEGDGVTLIREVVFPVGEYALAVKVTRERLPDEIRTTFEQDANPLRSLVGQQVKLTVMIQHPYDVLSRSEGLLDIGDRSARVGSEGLTFPVGAAVTGVPYRTVTVAVPRGFLKKPLLYRFDLADLPSAPADD